MSRREGGSGGRGEEPAAVSSAALEEKARRLLKRCRYEDAAKAFRQVVLQVQQGRDDSGMTCYDGGGGDRGCDVRDVTREIGALEGLAICLSRQVE